MYNKEVSKVSVGRQQVKQPIEQAHQVLLIPSNVIQLQIMALERSKALRVGVIPEQVVQRNRSQIMGREQVVLLNHIIEVLARKQDKVLLHIADSQVAVVIPVIVVVHTLEAVEVIHHQVAQVEVYLEVVEVHLQEVPVAVNVVVVDADNISINSIKKELAWKKC